MLRSSARGNSAIPDEYKKITKNLFPADENAVKGPGSKAALEFANALGIGTDYRRFLEINKESEKEMDELLENFRNNLDLLIQKTWVEKTDEVRKDKLQDDVPGFVTGIKQGTYQKALEEFGIILEELAYLFFGAQSTRDDFTEYTFRIDNQMGLFWWYGSQIGNLKEMYKKSEINDESLWAVLLLGICYLTNF